MKSLKNAKPARLSVAIACIAWVGDGFQNTTPQYVGVITEEVMMSEGIYKKFDVKRTDGKSEPGCKHEGCTYFVLDLDHDKHAEVALRAYVDSCADEHPELASDLLIMLDSEFMRNPDPRGM